MWAGRRWLGAAGGQRDRRRAGARGGGRDGTEGWREGGKEQRPTGDARRLLQGFGVEGLEQLSLEQGAQGHLTAHQGEGGGIEVLADARWGERVRFVGGVGGIEGIRVGMRERELGRGRERRKRRRGRRSGVAGHGLLLGCGRFCPFPPG